MSRNNEKENEKEVTVKLRYLRMSPKKVAQVAALVRGKPLAEALAVLKLTPKKAAHYLRKLLHSAQAAAAEKGLKGDKTGWLVEEMRVDGGPSLKRGQPVARGVWHSLLKRTSHLTVKLKEAAP
jgi:large subunit ribosomal protein L22